LQEAYETGERIFGENKVQELLLKQPLFPADVQWHLIGHLQTNKVKYIASFVDMIESVDSLKLLYEIDRQAIKFDKKQKVLLQFHIAEEETKFGFNLEEANEMLTQLKTNPLKNIVICGVMGMATFTDDLQQLTKEFRHLKQIFDQLKADYFETNDYFTEISMGMSGDFELAIAEGATMVRVGTRIFGKRNYTDN
ncbi:MAG: YggS family pyridoxal phosphate-dependent enzyme, partial [Bacteroidales bacterium]|nr:YggS family pyridoxal phosphate-dependent enzyme [Bacteroidales bacterium]